MNKKIRSQVVKDTLLDYNSLANSLRENTESAVKSLLDEAVRDTYAKLLSEDEGKDYEEDEVEDTESDTVEGAENGDVADSGTTDGESAEMEPSEDGNTEDAAIEEPNENGLGDENNPIEEPTDDGEGEDEWGSLDKYKVSDNEYDFSQAEDEDVVKVWKLMKDDDQVFVQKDSDGKVELSDNSTGAEYLLDLGGGAAEDNESNDVFGIEDENDVEKNDMNEAQERMYELVLEYDSNVGYTDNYQKKDVMTNPGMSEPAKNANDWDAGAPKSTSKPWSGYPSKKNKANKPFNDAKGKTVAEGAEEPIEESAAERGGRMGAHGRMTGTKSHLPQNAKNPKGQHHVSQNGEYKGDEISEAALKRINKALAENKELKSTLTQVMESLKEAAVVNHNLAKIVNLVTENATTKDEKKEIVARFAKEAKTIEQSEALYESLSKDLQKTKQMNINEEKTLTVESSQKINETSIYKSKDMLASLDLMSRVMKY